MSVFAEWWSNVALIVGGLAGLGWFLSALGESWFRYQVVKRLRGIEHNLKREKRKRGGGRW